MQRRPFLFSTLAAGLALPARAQPGRTLRLILPFTPGGSTDILARAIGPKLGAALGRTVAIDNKPGAAGSLDAAEAAKAEPDGHTLLMGHIGTLAVNPAIYTRLGYDPPKSSPPWPGWHVCPTCLWCRRHRRRAASGGSSSWRGPRRAA